MSYIRDAIDELNKNYKEKVEESKFKQSLTREEIDKKLDVIENQLKTIESEIEKLDGIEIIDRDELDDEYTNFTKTLNRLGEVLDELRWY